MGNVAFSNEPTLNASEWLAKKRKGIVNEDKYVKKFYGLECGILAKTTELTHEEWLEARKLGITGTDLGGLTSVSKYSTPMKVYLDKVGASEPTPDNEKMYWGRVMEDVVKKEFALRNPELKVKKANVMFQHKTNKWALANVDALVRNGDDVGILEIKTVSEYLKSAWEGEEAPPQYIVQIQWYMYVTGAKFGYFAALIGGNQYIQKYVERDEELINMLVEIAEDFWKNNVKKRIPPQVDGSDTATTLLNALYPISEDKGEFILDDEAIALIDSRNSLKIEADEINIKIKECENKLKEMLKENECGIVGDKKVIWKTYSRTSIDSKALKEEEPELFKKYSKTSSYRKFDIK